MFTICFATSSAVTGRAKLETVRCDNEDDLRSRVTVLCNNGYKLEDLHVFNGERRKLSTQLIIDPPVPSKR